MSPEIAMNMLPEVGYEVSFNHDFLKLWFRHNGYLGQEAWTERFVVERLRQREYGSVQTIYVRGKESGHLYSLFVTGRGELDVLNSFPEYFGIPVFNIHSRTVVKSAPNNEMYCSCGGPSKENWADGKRFYVCTSCKKEKV